MGKLFLNCNLVVPSEVTTLLEHMSNLCIEDNSKLAHEEVSTFLESQGFSCVWEYRVPDRGDGRVGKIDLIALRGEEQFAIEIDNTIARQKSIFKLNGMQDFIRVIVLRRAKSYCVPDGIHALIDLECIKKERKR